MITTPSLKERCRRALCDWEYEPASAEALWGAGLILTQCYSRMRDGSSGPGNQILAHVTISISRKLGLPVIAQEEVAWLLPEDVIQADIAAGSTDGKATLKWNTHGVAILQAEYCRKNQISTVIVVAHPLHMNRACWVYERLGLTTLPVAMPMDFQKYQHPDLVHWSCRGSWRMFRRREAFIARPYFLAKGWI